MMYCRQQVKAYSSAKDSNLQRSDEDNVDRTDLSRWRLVNDKGRHSWHYLAPYQDPEKWPMTIPEKWYLGLEMVGPLGMIKKSFGHR
jgi:hypothetical protein